MCLQQLKRRTCNSLRRSARRRISARGFGVAFAVCLTAPPVANGLFMMDTRRQLTCKARRESECPRTFISSDAYILTQYIFIQYFTIIISVDFYSTSLILSVCVCLEGCPCTVFRRHTAVFTCCTPHRHLVVPTQTHTHTHTHTQSSSNIHCRSTDTATHASLPTSSIMLTVITPLGRAPATTFEPVHPPTTNEFADTTVAGLLASFELNDKIYQHARSGSAQTASNLLVSMLESSGTRPEPSSFLSVIMAQAKSADGSARIAMDVLGKVARSTDEEVAPTGIMVNAVLDAHAKCHDGSAADAHRLLQDMTNVVRLDTISYNTAINCYAKCRDGSATGAMNVYADMHAAGVTANTVTFYSLIDAQTRNADGGAQAVLRILDDMVRTAGIQPDVAMYTNAINLQARSRDGSGRGALALLGRMKQAGIAPTAVTLNSVIDAQAKHRDGSAHVALRILDAMKKSDLKGVRPTVVTYSSAIDCQAKCSDGDGRTAVALLEEMCTEGITPNNITYGTCMNAQAKRGSAKMAMELLRKMLGQGLAPSHTQFNAVIDAHAKCPDGSAVEALLVLEQMTRHGAAPNVVSYSTCIDAQAKRNDGSAETAAQLLLRLLEQGLIPDTVTFAGVIDAQAKRKDGSAATAATILDRMQECVRPNQVHFNSVLNACANERPSAVHLAEPVLAQMLGKGYQPNQYTLSALFRCAGFCSPTRPDLAHRWFDTFCRSTTSRATVEINDHVSRALRVALGDGADALLSSIGSPLAGGGGGNRRNSNGNTRSPRCIKRGGGVGGGGGRDAQPHSRSPGSSPHGAQTREFSGSWRRAANTTPNNGTAGTGSSSGSGRPPLFTTPRRSNSNSNPHPHSHSGQQQQQQRRYHLQDGSGGNDWRSVRRALSWDTPPSRAHAAPAIDIPLQQTVSSVNRHNSTGPGRVHRLSSSPPITSEPTTPTAVSPGLKAALHTASASPGIPRRSLADKIHDMQGQTPKARSGSGSGSVSPLLLSPVYFESAAAVDRRRSSSSPYVRAPSGPDGSRGFGGRRSVGSSSGSITAPHPPTAVIG